MALRGHAVSARRWGGALLGRPPHVFSRVPFRGRRISLDSVFCLGAASTLCRRVIMLNDFHDVPTWHVSGGVEDFSRGAPSLRSVIVHPVAFGGVVSGRPRGTRGRASATEARLLGLARVRPCPARCEGTDFSGMTRRAGQALSSGTSVQAERGPHRENFLFLRVPGGRSPRQRRFLVRAGSPATRNEYSAFVGPSPALPPLKYREEVWR